MRMIAILAASASLLLTACGDETEPAEPALVGPDGTAITEDQMDTIEDRADEMEDEIPAGEAVEEAADVVEQQTDQVEEEVIE